MLSDVYRRASLVIGFQYSILSTPVYVVLYFSNYYVFNYLLGVCCSIICLGEKLRHYLLENTDEVAAPTTQLATLML